MGDTPLKTNKAAEIAARYAAEDEARRSPAGRQERDIYDKTRDLRGQGDHGNNEERFNNNADRYELHAEVARDMAARIGPGGWGYNDFIRQARELEEKAKRERALFKNNATESYQGAVGTKTGGMAPTRD